MLRDEALEDVETLTRAGMEDLRLQESLPRLRAFRGHWIGRQRG